MNDRSTGKTSAHIGRTETEDDSEQFSMGDAVVPLWSGRQWPLDVFIHVLALCQKGSWGKEVALVSLRTSFSSRKTSGTMERCGNC